MSGIDIGQTVDDFWDTFEKPVTSACRFYTYYYLSEVENQGMFGFDYNQVSTRLADDFFYYSLYACLKEATNMDAMVKVDIRDGANKTFNAWVRQNKRDVLREVIEPVKEEYGKGVAEKLKALIFRKGPKTVPVMEKDAKEALEEYEEVANMVSEPYEAFKAIEMAFSIEDLFEDFDSDVEWYEGWGGEAWGSVASMALKRPEFSDGTFVDLMWSIEHNNELFIDKVPTSRAELAKLEDFSSEIHGKDRSIQYRLSDLSIHDTLRAVLDDAREGNLYYIMKFVARDDENVRRIIRRKEPEPGSEFIEQLPTEEDKKMSA